MSKPSLHELRRQKKLEIKDTVENGPFRAEWKSLEEYSVPRWYEDAKFGIFIHWGVYSVPAFGTEWYARNMYREGTEVYEHHLKTYGPPDTFGYKDFIPQFTAEKFDAEEWAALFKRAGAAFVVPVAEHHDGFAMYDCPYSEWTAARMGPRRDIIGELGAAVAAALYDLRRLQPPCGELVVLQRRPRAAFRCAGPEIRGIVRSGAVLLR